MTNPNFIKYSVCAVLFTAGLYSLFMGIYHYKKPQKMLYEAVEEAYQEALKEYEEENKPKEEDKPQE